MKKLILTICILAMATWAHAEPAKTFGWDANTEIDLKGYRLYESDTSGAYVFGGAASPNFVTEILCGPNDPSCCEHFKEASPGPGKWYVCTAFDINDDESLPSNEIESLPPGQVKNFKFK